MMSSTRSPEAPWIPSARSPAVEYIGHAESQLKHLSLLHNDNYSHHEMGPSGGNVNDDSAGWLTALDQQMHSLESLVMSPEIEEYLEVNRDENPCIKGLRNGVGVEIAWSRPHPELSYWDGDDWGEPVTELKFTREG